MDIKRTIWIGMLLFAGTALLLAACASDPLTDSGEFELAAAAGGKEPVSAAPCYEQAQTGEDLDEKCALFYTKAFTNGDKQVLKDYVACLTEILASESNYCQLLISMGEGYDITLEACRSEFGEEKSKACEYFLENAFAALYEPVMFDYGACYDEVLASDQPYCQFLFDLSEETSLSFEECRLQYDLSAEEGGEEPSIECGLFIKYFFKSGSGFYLKDYIACEDEVLPSDYPYCQYLLELGEEEGVGFEGCRNQFDLSAEEGGKEPSMACYTYLQLKLEMVSEDVMGDLQACMDEVLAADMPYCQFLLETWEFLGEDAEG